MSSADFKLFRKKPVVISAVQFTYHNRGELIENIKYVHGERHGRKLADLCLFVETLEGGHIAVVGDWIIKGIEGEHYPCGPSVFAKTYESVK